MALCSANRSGGSSIYTRGNAVCFFGAGGYCVFMSGGGWVVDIRRRGVCGWNVGGLPREVEVGSVTHLTSMSINAMSHMLRNHAKMSRTDQGQIRRVLGRLSCRPGVCTDTLTSGGGCLFIYLLPRRGRNSC